MRYRTLGRSIKAAFDASYYRAAARTLRSFEHPWAVLAQYVGVRPMNFPRSLTARHGRLRNRFEVYSADDVVTAVECFGKLDYAAEPGDRCIVDFGSNIGISLMYFLMHAAEARLYAFEPDPRNAERLRRNLRGFENRYQLSEAAVGTSAGRARFGREPTGRYGGLGLDFADQIEVEVLDANAALAGILGREKRINLLKIDIEGQERALLEALTPDILAAIDRIAVEIAGTPPPLKGFRWRRHGGVVTYRRQ